MMKRISEVGRAFMERILIVFSDIFEVIIEVLEQQLFIMIARSSSEVVFLDI
jgi:hypothetical protein